MSAELIDETVLSPLGAVDTAVMTYSELCDKLRITVVCCCFLKRVSENAAQ